MPRREGVDEKRKKRSLASRKQEAREGGLLLKTSRAAQGKKEARALGREGCEQDGPGGKEGGSRPRGKKKKSFVRSA